MSEANFMVIDSNKNLPILLDFQCEGSKLILRIDKNGLLDFSDHDDSVMLIELEGADLSNVDLKNAKGGVFEHEFQKENGGEQLICYINYDVDEEIIPFTSSTISSQGYERRDLIQKGETLSSRYLYLQETFDHNYKLNVDLQTKLVNELNNEIERAQKKADHFAQTDIDRSHGFTHEKKVLEKLLRIVSN